MPEKYRPSNGTEGDIFTAEWCGNCLHYKDPETEEYCQILGDTFAFNVDDDNYPGEWTYDENGKPMCAAYNHNTETRLTPRCTRTEDMFEND